MIKLGEQYIEIEDVSFISILDRHINHGSGSSSNSVWFFMVIVGGQKQEIKGNTKEETIELRENLILSTLPRITDEV